MFAPGSFDQATACAEIRSRGYTLIPDFLDSGRLARVRAALDRELGAHRGRNNFEGHATERVYTLVARDAVFEEIVADSRTLALCDAFLDPNYLLTGSLAICIHPGESPQPWHVDDAFYPLQRPRRMVSLSTIVAVDDFSADNGGTEVIPGSHLWSDAEIGGDYRSGDHESDPEFARRMAGRGLSVEMPAGGCVVFAGNLLHRGGANRTQAPRRAFSIQYCQPWARTQENYFLTVPREQARAMSPRLQALLGYSIHPPFMGHAAGRHPLKLLAREASPDPDN
ncbi:MAG TPA: phytanoyl-CoA dioxygenase family protein [Porticoccaceae bacterium]|nr:phytanoyl-CoA dioxygenase family protein [Porticoccaceae bacterium]